MKKHTVCNGYFSKIYFLLWTKSRYSNCLYRKLKVLTETMSAIFLKVYFDLFFCKFCVRIPNLLLLMSKFNHSQTLSLFQYFCKAMYSMYLGFHSPQQSSSYDICNQNITAKITLHSLLWQKNMHSLGHRASMGLKKYWRNEKKRTWMIEFWHPKKQMWAIAYFFRATALIASCQNESTTAQN